MKSTALLLLLTATLSTITAQAQLTKTGCANLESVFLAFGYETTTTTKDMFRGCGCDFAVTIPRGSMAEAECADTGDIPNTSVDSIFVSNPPLIRRTFPSALVKTKGNSIGFEFLRQLTFTDDALRGSALAQGEMLPSLTAKIDISNNKELEPWPGVNPDGSKPYYSFIEVTQRNVPNACCPPGTPDAIACFPSSSICKEKPGMTTISTSSGSSSPAPPPAPPSTGTSGEIASTGSGTPEKVPEKAPVVPEKPATTTTTAAIVPPMVPTMEVKPTGSSEGTMPAMGMEGKMNMESSESGKKSTEAAPAEEKSAAVAAAAAGSESKGTASKAEAAKGEGKAEKKEEVQISTVAKIVGIAILGVFVVIVVIAATRMAMAGGGHEKKHVVHDVEAK